MADTGGSHLLIRGDSLHIPLKDGCIHACVSSPPYYSLRNYDLPPTRWPRMSYAPMVGLVPIEISPMSCCLGLEPSIEAYVGHLLLVYREVYRVVRPDSVTFVNLGDGYNSGTQYNGHKHKDGRFAETFHGANRYTERGDDWPGHRPLVAGIKPKNLLMVPARFALAAQADGWYIRAAPPWIKPGSAMPESTVDRPNVAHESIFMLTKGPRYYFDMQAVKRGSATVPHARKGVTLPDVSSGLLSRPRSDGSSASQFAPEEQDRVWGSESGRHYRTSDTFLDSLDSAIAHHAERLAALEAARDHGGLLADGDGTPEAFLVNPQAYRGSHFATFPVRLVTDMIRASTSENVCGACGMPYERITERGELVPLPTSGTYTGRTDLYAVGPMDRGGTHQRKAGTRMSYRERTTSGFRPACPCPPDTPPGKSLVLDCFAGSGTTIHAAELLGRRGVGIDLSASYQSLARDRVTDAERPHRAKARPGKAPAGGPTLFPE
jgi:DNA modification methylase